MYTATMLGMPGLISPKKFSYNVYNVVILGSQTILTEDVSIQKVFYTNPLELLDRMPAY